MARILYAVNGEGMGHAIRSKVIIDYLLKKKHEIVIVAGGRAFDFLSENFDNVYNIETYNIVYKDNAVQNISTSIQTLKKFPKALARNMKQLIKIIIKYEPQLVITDFEAFSNFISKVAKLPVIAIDNISIINKAKVPVPLSELHSYLVAKFVTKSFVRINADRHIIPTFFDAELKDSKTVLVPSVIRDEIIKTKPRNGDHIIVYQTSITNKKLISELKKIDEKFLIYGFDADKTEKNITFRKFSEKSFIGDLASSKALIVNGGFTTISEAIYFKKPVFSIPVRRQFEQLVNAIYIDRLGYGEYHKSVDSSAIKNFIANIPEYKKNLELYSHDNNKKLFSEIDKAVRELII